MPPTSVFAANLRSRLQARQEDPPEIEDGSPEGLSSYAIAGIGVACLVVVIASSYLIYRYLKRRKRVNVRNEKSIILESPSKPSDRRIDDAGDRLLGDAAQPGTNSRPESILFTNERDGPNNMSMPSIIQPPPFYKESDALAPAPLATRRKSETGLRPLLLGSDRAKQDEERGRMLGDDDREDEDEERGRSRSRSVVDTGRLVVSKPEPRSRTASPSRSVRSVSRFKEEGIDEL